MDCKYCAEYCGEDSKEDIYNDRKLSHKRNQIYVGTQIYIEDNNLHLFAVADTYEPGFIEAKAPINFCPMCGRKLTTQTE